MRRHISPEFRVGLIIKGFKYKQMREIEVQTVGAKVGACRICSVSLGASGTRLEVVVMGMCAQRLFFIT
jgi:hypothetical protein